MYNTVALSAPPRNAPRRGGRSPADASRNVASSPWQLPTAACGTRTSNLVSCWAATRRPHARLVPVPPIFSMPPAGRGSERAETASRLNEASITACPAYFQGAPSPEEALPPTHLLARRALGSRHACTHALLCLQQKPCGQRLKLRFRERLPNGSFLPRRRRHRGAARTLCAADGAITASLHRAVRPTLCAGGVALPAGAAARRLLVFPRACSAVAGLCIERRFPDVPPFCRLSGAGPSVYARGW